MTFKKMENDMAVWDGYAESKRAQKEGAAFSCKVNPLVRCSTPLCGREANAYVLRLGVPKCDICIERNCHVIKRRIKKPNAPHEARGE